jgi:predicted TIM-barrel fold metal-dependent hydrolase
LKLQPCAGWYPNDRIVYPVYKKCVELGIPVNFHTGPQPYPFKSKCGHPKYIEDVADDFPELTIHCTHAGDVLYMEMLALAKAHQNVIVDFASWQRWLGGSRTTALSLYRTMRIFMDMLGPRVMFGSDFDGKLGESGYCDWVKALVDIPSWVKEAGIEFTKDEMDGFLGGNAVKLLRL